MTEGTIKYIINILIQRGLGILLYLVGSGWLMNSNALIYFLCYISTSVISLSVMAYVNPQTLAERNKRNTDSPVWDKILLGCFWLLAYFIIYLAAGWESRNLGTAGGILFWVGILLSLLDGVITLWALIENTFLESTARIQKERHQTVCQTGPYRLVRHPAYLGLLIWCAGISLVFPTPGVVLCAVLIALIIVLRTWLEDRLLLKHLDGYPEYSHKVKYRLLPFIW